MAVTGNILKRMLRARLNDEGDDTQLSNGTANPQYFWSDAELLLYLNAAQNELFRVLCNLDKRNELKDDISSTTSTTLPADFYKPVISQVNGFHSVLYDDPSDLTHIDQTKQEAVSIVGSTVYITPSTGTYKLIYYKLPVDLVFNNTTLLQFTNEFYLALLPAAEHFAIHKDAALERNVSRRQFGIQSIQMVEIQDYLNSIT